MHSKTPLADRRKPPFFGASLIRNTFIPIQFFGERELFLLEFHDWIASSLIHVDEHVCFVPTNKWQNPMKKQEHITGNTTTAGKQRYPFNNRTGFNSVNAVLFRFMKIPINCIRANAVIPDYARTRFHYRQLDAFWMHAQKNMNQQNNLY